MVKKSVLQMYFYTCDEESSGKPYGAIALSQFNINIYIKILCTKYC